MKSHFQAAAGAMVLIIAISISCSSNPGSVEGLSVDSLKQADVKMQAHVDKGDLPCVASLILKDGNIANRSPRRP